MKKIRIFFGLFMAVVSLQLHAQQNVSISDVNGVTPDASSVLDVSSTSKGLLIPRMTTIQRNAISNPANGLIVYDTDVKCFMYWTSFNSSWNYLCNTGSNGSNMLANTTSESPGANCPAGGVKIEFGLDANNDLILNVSEVNATLTKYVCNGATGAQGIQGVAGTNGATGAQGIQGVAGTTGAQGPAGPVGCATANYIIKSNGTSATCTVAPIFEDASGNVGIGNISPLYKLDITPAATTGTGIRVADNGSNAGVQLVAVGDDSYLTDLDAANMLGVYGQQTSTEGGVQLGSGGGYIYGKSGNVGIGTINPNASSLLEVNSTSKGILIPQVSLSATNTAGPITSPATSLLVYNIATSGDVTPGFYHWANNKWNRFDTGNNIGDWKLLGNAGTNVGSNFLGTTDAVDLVLRTNNLEKFRISSNGNMTFNNSNFNQDYYRFECNIQLPSTDVMAIYNSGGQGANQWPLNVYNSTSDGGVVYGYASNFNNNNIAINGVNEGGVGVGVRGFVPSLAASAAIGVQGTSNNSRHYGVFGSIPTTGAWTGFGGIFTGGLGYLNGIYALSDSIFKTDIKPIQNAINTISKIEGKQYLMKSPYKTLQFASGYHFGFIAQELQEVLPEAVATKVIPVEFSNTHRSSIIEKTAEVKMIDYTILIPFLVEAIKEQQVIIEELQKRIEILEKK